MADSPLKNAVGVLRIIVYADGKQIDEQYRIESVSVDYELNKIPHASLSIIDGDVPGQNMPASNAKCFKPGTKIKIECGYDNVADTLFEGIIIKQAVQISAKSSSLAITCKDEAMKMESGEQNKNFEKMTESDIIKELITNNGLKIGKIESKGGTLEKTQRKTTDWKYLLKLASSIGLMVRVFAGEVSAESLKTADGPVLTLTYGVDIESFSSEVDATKQISEVEAIGWDPSTQKTISQEGKSGNPIKQGSLSRAELSKIINPKKQIIHANQVTEKELQNLADAALQQSELNRMHGSISFQGNDKVLPGKRIEIKGVGDIHSGIAYISAVSHSLSGGNWKTTVKFGIPPTDLKSSLTGGGGAQANSLGNTSNGMQIGKVAKLDEDPNGEYRIQVELPMVEDEDKTIWARLSQFYASGKFGSFFLPEIDDEVIIAFINDDPSQAVILGSLYSAKLPPSNEIEAENNIKSILTRSKLKLEFDEEKKAITIETPGGNKMVLSDEEKSILLTDQNSNKVELGTGGITLESPKDIVIKATGKITMDAKTGMELTTKAALKVKGMSVDQSADTSMTLKGNASAEISASGQTTVKGAMVMIN